MEEFVKKIRPDTTQFDTFKERVIRECNVSRQAWFNWAKGMPMLDKYKPIIDRIAMEVYGKKVFEK